MTTPTTESDSLPLVATAGVAPSGSGAALPRLESLDAYRGLIMATLLCGAIFGSLKGDPTWNWLYLQNEHVEWQGCVYWDLIQPSFMYMVGVAMPFALARRAARGDSWGKRFRHVLARALGLILVGIVLDNFGADRWSIGFIRVLQQIAVGYVLAFFVVGKSFRTQALTAGAILMGYNLLWMFNPWNGSGGPWAKGNANIGSAFDFWMLGRHYSGYYVGMNAIPSTATIIFGVMAGQLIMKRLPPRRTMGILLIAGLCGVGAGLLMSPWLPLIKRIWTPSFAVYAGGWTTLMLVAFYWSIEVMGWKHGRFRLLWWAPTRSPPTCWAMPSEAGFAASPAQWIGWLREPLGVLWFPVFQHLVIFALEWLVLYWLWKRRIFFKV